MLITKEVEILLNGGNSKYYEEKGYEIPRRIDKYGRVKIKNGTKIKVLIQDVPLGSNAEVLAQCDYCYEKGIITQYSARYYQYNKSRKIISKDCCNDTECMKKKREDSVMATYNVKNVQFIEGIEDKKKSIFMDKYGVDNISKTDYFKEKYKEVMLNNYGVEHYSYTDEYKEKTKATSIKRYGVENYSSTPECREKVKNTNISLFGVENPSQTEWFQEKRLKTMISKYGVKSVLALPERKDDIFSKARKTMYLNGSAPCSKQQKYICNLLGCKLNYPIHSFSLDMVFLDEKIYIEYDGGGHELSVIFNQIDEKSFRDKERRRHYFLKGLGWKMIRIISKSDFIPQDEVITKIIKQGKEYLNLNHSWIEYDIDQNKIKCSQYEKYYDFGELRKIHKENIKSIQ